MFCNTKGRGRCLLRGMLGFGKRGLLAIWGSRLGEQQGGYRAGRCQCDLQHLEARGFQAWRKRCLAYSGWIRFVALETIERILVLARRRLRGNVGARGMEKKTLTKAQTYLAVTTLHLLPTSLTNSRSFPIFSHLCVGLKTAKPLVS